MIPFQFGGLGVGDNPTLEIDIVLLLNITAKIGKVSTINDLASRDPP